MGFLMDGLEGESYDRAYKDDDLVRRILDYFRPQQAAMVGVALLVVLNSLADAVVPILLAAGINQIVEDGNEFTRTTVLLVIGVLVAGLVAWIINYIRQWQTARIVGDVVLQLRLDTFKAVLKRDLSFFDEVPAGRIISRVTSDTEDFANTVTLTLNLISQVLLIFILTGVLLYRDWRLTLLALLLVPAITAVALAFRRIARSSTLQSQRALSLINTKVQESMRGIAVAKNFRQEDRIYEEFGDVRDVAYKATLRQGFIFAGIFPLLFAIAGLATTMLVYVGGNRVIDGSISAGDWFLFLQSVALFWFPLTSIASFWSQFQQGLSAAERVFAIIDATPRVVQISAVKPPLLAGQVEFQHVDFAYVDGEPVLSDFSLKIEPGETVALVGATGAGKSTIGKLIARFYEFQEGQILLDGQDVRTLDLEAYRQQLGVVPQIPFLFSGTAMDNIRYARPEATDAEVEEAARRIGGGDWIAALPDGLQTAVGEQGRSLSLGQRQLIALARLLVQNPRIVVLDEATASVDPLTESQIQEGLDEALKDRTAIVIAHRLVTVRHADRIIVLEDGRIVEEGTHRSLLESGGRYADLYNTYFLHQSPDYRPAPAEETVAV